MKLSHIPWYISLPAIFAVIALAIAPLYTTKSQRYNLDKIDLWLNSHMDRWGEIVSKDSSLSGVKISAYTGNNGMIGVIFPENISDSAKLKTLLFIVNNYAPRPIHIFNN